MGTHPIFESDFDCLTGSDEFRASALIMRYVAAYLLAQLGGNDSPSADNIKSILSSVGIDADEEKLGLVISQLSGKDINEVIAEGKEKLASVPTGAAAAEETKEEAKAESSEDSGDDDMGFGLFD